MGEDGCITKEVAKMAEEVARLFTADLDMQLAATPEQWCDAAAMLEKAEGSDAFRIYKEIELERFRSAEAEKVELLESDGFDNRWCERIK